VDSSPISNDCAYLLLWLSVSVVEVVSKLVTGPVVTSTPMEPMSRAAYPLRPGVPPPADPCCGPCEVCLPVERVAAKLHTASNSWYRSSYSWSVLEFRASSNRAGSR
jgi:hypothetical protein